MQIRNYIPLVIFIAVFALGGCTREELSQKLADSREMSATADLLAKSGSKVSGELRFTEVSNGVRIEGELSGLEPGAHGMHVHEFGSCEGDDAAAAGGHFALPSQKHGALKHEGSHYGDLGNINANAKGVAKVDIVAQRLCLNADKDCSVLGKAIVVHAKEDDLKTDPSGNSGGRVGCGLISKS